MELNSLSRLTQTFAVSGFLLGTMGFFGWIFNIEGLTSFFPTLVSMKMNTALSIMTLGIVCIFYRTRSWSVAVPILTTLVFVVAIATIAQYFIGVNWGIDEFLIRDNDARFTPPGRMSIITAVAFIPLTLAIFVRHFARDKSPIWQTMALLNLPLPILAIVALVFHPKGQPEIFPYQTIALPTSMALTFLNLSVITSRSEGLMANILSRRVGGRVARRYLPLLVLTLLALGFSTQVGSITGLFDHSFDVPYLLTLGSTFTAWIIWHAARALNDLDENLEVEKMFHQDLNEHLKLLIDHSPGATALFDRDMKYIWANARWMQDLLPHLKDVTGLSIYETFTELDTKWREIYERCLAGAIERGSEERHVDEAGNVRWYRWEIRPWTSAHGGIGGLVIFSENITEQKLAALQAREREVLYRQQLEKEVAQRTSELKISQQKYKRLVEDGFDPVLVIDQHEQIVFYNTQLELLFGYGPGELLGLDVSILVPMRFRNRHKAFTAHYLKSPARRPMARSMDLFALKKDGSEIPVEVSLSPISTPEGDQVTVIVRDVTERKYHEQTQHFLTDLSRSLVESLDRNEIIKRTFELTTRHLAETCTIRGPDGRILFSNDGSSPKSRSKIELPIKVFGQPAGSITLGSDSVYRRLPTDRAFIGNVVSRIEAALTNAELYQQARQATREREAILGIVSHDLKNPVSVIQMSAELLMHSQLSFEEVQKMGSRLKSSAQHMNRLIDDLLHFAKIEAKTLHVSPVATTVHAIVEDAVATLKEKFSARQIELQVTISPALPPVLADPVRIVQVLWNLLGNALKFSSIGGKVTLSVCEDQNRIRFSVQDRGPGIPLKDQDSVFKSFWQAKKTADMGTGLGLAIAKGIIEAHGGRIWVESEFGKGATFHFLLQKAPARTVVNPATWKGKKILCVDDSQDNLDLLKLTLDKIGADAYLATSVTEALGQLPKLQPNLVITDIEMPVHNGFDLLRGIRSLPQLSAIPVVAFTANSLEQTDPRLIRAGFDGVIPKPFSLNQLETIVQQVLKPTLNS